MGEAESGDEAVALAARPAARRRPDGRADAGSNGIEATRQIVGASPQIGVLVLTMIEDDDAVFAAIRAGARGYLVKGSSQTEILHAVRAVAAGEAVFGPAIANRLMQYFSVSAEHRLSGVSRSSRAASARSSSSSRAASPTLSSRDT